MTHQHIAPPHLQHLVFQSTVKDVRRALDTLFNGFRPLCLPAEESGTIELVLAEVLNNVVEHAYENRPNGRIELHAEQMPDGFRFEVIDEGREMPDGKLPSGHLVPIDTDLTTIPEGGFGWFLIQDLATDIHYRRSDGKNHLSFCIAVACPVLRSKPGSEPGVE